MIRDMPRRRSLGLLVLGAALGVALTVAGLGFARWVAHGTCDSKDLTYLRSVRDQLVRAEGVVVRRVLDCQQHYDESFAGAEVAGSLDCGALEYELERITGGPVTEPGAVDEDVTAYAGPYVDRYDYRIYFACSTDDVTTLFLTQIRLDAVRNAARDTAGPAPDSGSQPRTTRSVPADVDAFAIRVLPEYFTVSWYDPAGSLGSVTYRTPRFV